MIPVNRHSLVVNSFFALNCINKITNSEPYFKCELRMSIFSFSIRSSFIWLNFKGKIEKVAKNDFFLNLLWICTSWIFCIHFAVYISNLEGQSLNLQFQGKDEISVGFYGINRRLKSRLGKNYYKCLSLEGNDRGKNLRK